MYAFTYEAPTSTAAAAAQAAAGARPIAGGQSLLPSLRLRLADPGQLVDLGRIPELAGIRKEGDHMVIGAMTRQQQVADSAEVRAAIPALADLADHIGDRQVRARGTLGGSVANNDPAACYPSAALALGATIVTNKRRLKAEEFFQGLFSTALDEGEVVTAVEFPLPKKAGYAKFPNPASRYALAGVFVAKMKNGSVRVAATGVGEGGVLRFPALEAALQANWSAAALANVAVSPEGLLSDIHGSAEYRANLVNVMARRAVAAAG